jgi:hypothetical protein
VTAIRADHQLRVNRPCIRLNPGHPTAVHYQPRNPGLRSYICTCFASRIDQKRVQCHPPHAQGRPIERPVGRHLDANVIVHHGESIERDRASRQNRVQRTQTVQHLHPTRLDHMGGRGFGRKLCAVKQTDVKSPPGKHRRQR